LSEEVKVRLVAWCVTFALVVLFPEPRPARAQDNKAEVRAVTYEHLKQAVLKQRGKVLVVDFWGEF